MAEMTATVFAAFVREYVTYKPDVKIDVDSDHGCLRVRAFRRVTDAYDPTTTTLNSFAKSFVPMPYMDLKFLEHWLVDFFHQWEKHEADEWLKVSGQRINNPHARDNG